MTYPSDLPKRGRSRIGDVCVLGECVAYVALVKDGRIKIGSTTRLHQRMQELRATLLCFEPGGEAREREIQEQFVAHRTDGRDWFRQEREILEYANAVRARRGQEIIGPEVRA